jgi:predicted Zn-dependent protease
MDQTHPRRARFSRSSILHPLLGTLLCLTLLIPGFGCAISEEQEIEMGRQTHGQFEKEFGGLYPDERVQQYVDKVGHSLADFAGRPNLPWQYRVVSSDQINAFALPGGYVYITKGLLSKLQNEAQLASILGHETGHVIKRHSVQQIQRAQGAQFIPLLAGIFGGGTAGDVAATVTQLGLMKYGRDQEREADFEGLKYMERGGYDPEGIVQAMEILQKASGGRGLPEFLSTHPNPGNRIEYLSEAIEKSDARQAGARIVGEESFRENVLDRLDQPARHR